MPYQTINSGKNPRREYLTTNRSPLFQGLPERDYAQEQKLSYHNFLYDTYKNGELLKPSRLSQLLDFYFPKENPAEFSDYNNNIKISVENFVCEEPEMTEEQARTDSLTWNHVVSFDWKVS